MGVGKSTIGRRLAKALDRNFVDVDEEIERAADRSVGEIFEQHGEAYFRDGERRVIARLMEEGHGVIATGGGAFTDAETRALVLKTGIAVWLDCDLDTLVERTSRKDTRPSAEIRRSARHPARAERAARAMPTRRRRSMCVTDDGPHDAAVERIMAELSAWR